MKKSTTLPPPDYERTDGSPVGIVATAIGLVAGIAATLAISGVMYQIPSGGSRGGPEARFENGAYAQTGIARDWAEQDAAVRQRLETYGWVDRKTGVVRIPIDRAMDLLADESKKEGAR